MFLLLSEGDSRNSGVVPGGQRRDGGQRQRGENRKIMLFFPNNQENGSLKKAVVSG